MNQHHFFQSLIAEGKHMKQTATKLMQVAVIAATLGISGQASAGMLGTQVTGLINFGSNPINYFNSTNGFVPGGCGNSCTGAAPVAIGAGTEFCFFDGANRDIADFSDTQLTISDTVFSGATNWHMAFTTLTPGLFGGLSLATEAFNPDLTYNITGDTINIYWAGTGTAGSNSTTFNVNVTSVPEPTTLGLLGLGLLGLGFMKKRKA